MTDPEVRGDRRTGRSLWSSIGWLSGGSLLARLIGALSGVLAARALGVEGRGQLAIAMVVGMLAGGILPVGLDLWAARALGSGAAMSGVRRVLASQLVGAVALVGVALAVLAGAAEVDLALLAATAVLCVTSTASAMRLGVLQGLNEMTRYSAANVVSTGLYAAGLVGLVVVGAANVTLVVLAAAASQLLIAVWPARDRRRSTDDAFQVDYRSAVRFGVPTAAGAVGAMLLYRLDVLLVSLWSGVDSAGLYVVALAYTEIVWIVPTAAAQALVPHAAQADSRIDTGRLCRSVVVLMVVVAAVLSLAGPAVVPWVFGADFQEAVVAVLPLSLAAIAVGVWKLVGHDLIARGDSHSRLWSGVLGIATMVALDAVLVPRFGVRGAAFGSLGAYAVASAVVVARWCRRFGVGPATLLVPRREDLTYILRRSRGVFSTTGRHERPAETRGGTEGE